MIYQQAPAITWATPLPIVYGTALGAAQLDASSPVAGSFTYSPAAGTVLNVGQQTLQATFTPTDTTDYTTATATVTLMVIPGTPVVTLTASANPVFMTYAVSFTASLPVLRLDADGHHDFLRRVNADWHGYCSERVGHVHDDGAGGGSSLDHGGVFRRQQLWSGDDAALFRRTCRTSRWHLQAQGSGSATVPAGGQAVYTLVITPVGGATLPASVNLTAVETPLGATASFSPATVAASSGATTVTLQMKLPASAALERPRSPFGGGVLPVALGLILLPFAGRMRKGRAHLTRLAVLAVISAALAMGFTGCGSAGFSSQNFSFTVTAASGSLSHSVTAQLTVK